MDCSTTDQPSYVAPPTLRARRAYASRNIVAHVRTHAALIAITAAYVLFRLPALLNPGMINSDGAIAGLQARHMMRGEWMWLHWGRDYIIAIDSVMAIPSLVLFGQTPLGLLVATMCGQLTSIWFAYAIIRKRLDRATAGTALLPLVFTTLALNIYLFFDIRQWCLATAMASFWLLDGASSSRRPLLRYAAGVFVGINALFFDLFAIQFVPGLALFALLCCLDSPRYLLHVAKRAGAMGIGALGGWKFLATMRHAAGVGTHRADWDLSLIPHNLNLLWDTCLPWLIGGKVLRFADSGPSGGLEPWLPPPWYSPLSVFVLVAFACVLIVPIISLCNDRIPWKVRRVGMLGCAVAGSSLAGFLVSTAVEDIWASRMLAPIALTFPFALVPTAWLLGRRLFPVALAPYVVATAVSGWIGFGPLVDGVIPTSTPRGIAREEARVATMLRNRGIHYAAAQYWLAYRLSFIFKEDPVVTPLDPTSSQDRYPPQIEAFQGASKVAYIFHPSQPFADASNYEASLRQSSAEFEKVQDNDFTIFIVKRR
jgi:hypothetical protein